MNNDANPRFKATAFICPHCCRNEHQVWGNPIIIHKSSNSWDCYNLRFSECQWCHWRMVWIDHLNPIYWITAWKESNIVFPINYNKKLKINFSKDTPQIVANDLKEAASIVDLSPRWACALLRLSLQKFLDIIIVRVSWKKKNTIDESIKFLLEKDIISNDINNIMHTLRIVWNEAVHPWLMDLEDNKDIALKMFEFFNYLVKTIITDNKEKIKIFNMLPENKRKDAIKNNELIAKILEIDSVEKDDDVKFIPWPKISTIKTWWSNIPSRSIF